jgi:hypothetical protein
LRGAPILQCHTNVISVFDELEPQPAFFSSSSSKPAGLLDVASGAGQAGEQPQPQQQQLEQRQRQQQRQPRSDKLAGMSQIICLANLTTALFYSCVGESALEIGDPPTLAQHCTAPHLPTTTAKTACLQRPCCLPGQHLQRASVHDAFQPSLAF